MKLVLAVIGDGRGEYLERAVAAAEQHIVYPIDARIMVDDSGDDDYGLGLDRTYPGWVVVHGGRRGMAGAVQAGFDAVLACEPDYVFWCEEDMVLTRDLPIADALHELETHPNVAQMCFKREAIDPTEGTDQLAAIVAQASQSGETDSYTWHDFIFSMNPCLIPRRVLEAGWPAGPIGIGNEAGMTRKLRAAGYVFGQWGHVGDEAWGYHIGYADRSAGYRL